MKGSKRVVRALGHTKTDLADHLRLDHKVKLGDWRKDAFRTLSARHNAVHAAERALDGHGHKANGRVTYDK